MKLFVHCDSLQSVNKAPDLPVKRTRVDENSDGCSSKDYGLTSLEEPFMGCESGLLATEDVDICSEGMCNDDQEPDSACEQRPDVIDDNNDIVNLQESADLDTTMFFDMETDEACCAQDQEEELGVGSVTDENVWGESECCAQSPNTDPLLNVPLYPGSSVTLLEAVVKYLLWFFGASTC